MFHFTACKQPCTVLHHNVPHCIVLDCIHCTVVLCMLCTTMHALHCTALHATSLSCSTVQRSKANIAVSGRLTHGWHYKLGSAGKLLWENSSKLFKSDPLRRSLSSTTVPYTRINPTMADIKFHNWFQLKKSKTFSDSVIFLGIRAPRIAIFCNSW